MYLQELGVDLEQEGEAAGFLVVTLERESNTIFLEMKKLGWFSLLLNNQDCTMV